MTRVAKYMTSRPWLGGGLVALVTLVAVGGWYVWDQVNVPDITVSYAVPTAPQLAAGGSSQTLYRIDPLESSVTYAVDEILAGCRAPPMAPPRALPVTLSLTMPTRRRRYSVR